MKTEAAYLLLTDREKTIFIACLGGDDANTVARVMKISPRTVSNTVARIRLKLAVPRYVHLRAHFRPFIRNLHLE